MLTETEVIQEVLPTIGRITKDAKAAAQRLSHREARFLVDSYYMLQEYRKRVANQERALGETGEPNTAIAAFTTYFKQAEDHAAKLLNHYSKAQPVGRWARSIIGIGPIIAAGLMSYVDLRRCPNYGALWTHAGLAQAKWIGKEKAAAVIADVRKWHSGKKPTRDAAYMLTRKVHRSPEAMAYWLTKREAVNHTEALDIIEEYGPTWIELAKWASLCPHNASLKTLCWKIGESFMKSSGNPKSHYGKIYRDRYTHEWERNYEGELISEAVRKMSECAVGESTDSYAWYMGCIKPEDARMLMAITDSKERMKAFADVCGEPGSGVKMLPPAHILARAKRIAVKTFLVDYFEQAWRSRYGTEPPVRYTHKDHGYPIGKPKVPQPEYDPETEVIEE